ncbi:unnamed protein product [Phyllotreta striolata]|uniref:Uncharacterized protein n=1 Tax=Phyllotreta striolata TaxID=444603 RepID=A0A9P0E1R0_PHYSR|nr:unnamed protein product [Phyllotreta striolata]
MEATWRILEFPLQGRSHSVIALPVHLPGDRQFMLDELEEGFTEANFENVFNKSTKLEAFFQLNRCDARARQYYYYEIPEHYVWNVSTGEWQPRRQRSKQVGCVVNVEPFGNERTELWYLRLLLSRIKGPTSFEHLKRLVDDDDASVTETFGESCRRRGLLNADDNYFDRCLSEASLFRQPRKLRRLFAHLCCITRDGDMDIMGPLFTKYIRQFTYDYVTLQRIPSREAVRLAYEDIAAVVQRNRHDIDLLQFNIRPDLPDNDLPDDFDDEPMPPSIDNFSGGLVFNVDGNDRVRRENNNDDDLPLIQRQTEEEEGRREPQHRAPLQNSVESPNNEQIETHSNIVTNGNNNDNSVRIDNVTDVDNYQGDNNSDYDIYNEFLNDDIDDNNIDNFLQDIFRDETTTMAIEDIFVGEDDLCKGTVPQRERFQLERRVATEYHAGTSRLHED